MKTSTEAEPFVRLEKDLFNMQVQKAIGLTVAHFDRIIKSYVTFNIGFVSLAAIEILLFVLFFTWLMQSSILAVSLALIFLTAFSYFIIKLYLRTKRPLQFIRLREEYVGMCKELLRYQDGVPEHHMALATACVRCAAALQGREGNYYQAPKNLEFLAPTLEKLSCWWHWQDILRMRELLLLYSVDEHIKLVKCDATGLEVHTALANSYVMLSTLYVDPRKGEGYDEDSWTPPSSVFVMLDRKFREAAERAIEEFKILNDYAPNDPWIHAQLAYSYHDLQMPQEEIREYETILKLRPDDRDTMFRLGRLYFQQGLNAKGLRVYESLKRANYKQAENLIKFYGDYGPHTNKP